MSRKILLITILFFLFTAIALIGTSCERYEPQPIPTNPIPSNPLEDLPWLKAKVNEFTSLSQQGDIISVYIYQCSYRDNDTGFLIDKGGIKTFYNYDGEVLCTTNEDTGKTCLELNINSENSKLIWKLLKGCGCDSMKHTMWQLVSFVNALTGVEKEPNPNPKNYEYCYTLFFDMDSTNIYLIEDEYLRSYIEGFIGIHNVFGRAIINYLSGIYEFDYKTCDVNIFHVGGTLAIDPGDAMRYYRIIRYEKFQFFTVENTSPRILRLYYNEGKDYLKLKEIGY